MNILSEFNTIADGELNRTYASAGDGYSLGQPVMGHAAPELTNYFGNKFTRGFLSGEGGQQDLDALGTLNFGVRPTPYNSHIQADVDAVRGTFSGESLKSNWSRSYVWGPANLFTPENIVTGANTLAMQGQDPVTGLFQAKNFAALDPITAAPTSQYYARGQVADGGDGLPSVSFRGTKIGKVPKSGSGVRFNTKAAMSGV